MKMKKKLLSRPLIVAVALVLLVGFAVYLTKYHQSKFEAPRQNAQIVHFRVGKEATLIGVIGNLRYYGFILKTKPLSNTP